MSISFSEAQEIRHGIGSCSWPFGFNADVDKAQDLLKHARVSALSLRVKRNALSDSAYALAGCTLIA
ncbi:MAG TPA: hypothetical protein DHV55_06535 [Clostridiaceae bacterium]|nr:hypothetical protein [Clostridiaceae bacterium]